MPGPVLSPHLEALGHRPEPEEGVKDVIVQGGGEADGTDALLSGPCLGLDLLKNLQEVRGGGFAPPVPV